MSSHGLERWSETQLQALFKEVSIELAALHKRREERRFQSDLKYIRRLTGRAP